MKQYEAVIHVMEKNSGYATLGLLYQEVLKISGAKWRTKTPYASIRRIVQDDRFFFKIKPGLWALKKYRSKLPVEILPAKEISRSRKTELDHAYYQGLLLEIGDLKKYHTSIPPQDKRKQYLGKTLGDIATIRKFYDFSYNNIVRKAKTVDVVWFNARKMPVSFFEIEHTTDMGNSLLKFVELQNFHANFYIVADKTRERMFKSKISYRAFCDLSDRVNFVSYGMVSNWHAKTYELKTLENELYL